MGFIRKDGVVGEILVEEGSLSGGKNWMALEDELEIADVGAVRGSNAR